MEILDLATIPKTEYQTEESWVDRGDFIYPDKTVKIRTERLNKYFYWIKERQGIWYKRDVLKEPAPWTQDPILQNYRFTNPIRDIDKVSVYYRENLLTHLEDTHESKVNLVFNTMVFRIFTKPEVWENIGYLDVYSDDIADRLSEAHSRISDYQRNGGKVFTGAYSVNPMRVIRNFYEPTLISESPKLDNAFLVIKHLQDNIHDIYREAIEEAKDMPEQLEYFKALPGIGHFNAYEWACDFCMAERYTGIPLVKWDDNSATNVGPGAKRGLDFIFEDLGNLNYMNALLLVAAIAENRFDHLGYTETMKWPSHVKTFNLRLIEHSLCEYHKYMKAYTGTGRPRQGFKKGMGVPSK